ncbi:MAG: aldehyde dehydrogenase family protein, partial [Actinobacteria bacterium]|nr:aldehyde dehydrogenase family protein [Actinomycetota bacterium]
MIATLPTIPGRHYIAGQWIASGQSFQSINPARCDEIIGAFPKGTKADADEAVAAARKAQPDWR